jgi:hypothetical protein
MLAKTIGENVFGFLKNAMYSIYKTNKKILPAHFDEGILWCPPFMCWQQQDPPFSSPERKDDINCNRWRGNTHSLNLKSRMRRMRW